MQRRGSVSISKNDKCPDCNIGVTEKDKGLQFEACEAWIHCHCQTISDENYKFLCQNEDAHWPCTS